MERIKLLVSIVNKLIESKGESAINYRSDLYALSAEEILHNLEMVDTKRRGQLNNKEKFKEIGKGF